MPSDLSEILFIIKAFLGCLSLKERLLFLSIKIALDNEVQYLQHLFIEHFVWLESSSLHLDHRHHQFGVPAIPVEQE